MRRWLWAPVVLICTTDARADSIGLVNGGFEMGNLTGWNVSNPDAILYLTGLSAPGGLIVAVPSGGTVTNLPASDALEGQYFAAVGTGHFHYRDMPATDFTASQTVWMDDGDVLSGWSRMFNGDVENADTVWVQILSSTQATIATPWSEISGPPRSGAPVPYLTFTEWTYWQWQAPAAGLYTIQLGASTAGDNRLASYGLHDAISVPEPSNSLLLGIGLLSILSLSWRYRPHPQTPIRRRIRSSL